MKKGFWKEGLSTRDKIKGTLFLACIVLFFSCAVAMFAGIFMKNETVMWSGVIGVFVSMLIFSNIKFQ